MPTDIRTKCFMTLNSRRIKIALQMPTYYTRILFDAQFKVQNFNKKHNQNLNTYKNIHAFCIDRVLIFASLIMPINIGVNYQKLQSLTILIIYYNGDVLIAYTCRCFYVQ